MIPPTCFGLLAAVFLVSVAVLAVADWESLWAEERAVAKVDAEMLGARFTFLTFRSALNSMQNQRRLFVAVIVFAPAFVTSTLAAQHTDPLSAQERIERATTYLKAFEALSEKIITLSPRQQEWLKKEREIAFNDDGTIANFDRYVALSDTKEYVIYETREYLDVVISWLELAQKWAKTGDRSTEMAAWSMVMHVLLTPTLAENVSELQDQNVLQQNVLCKTLKPVHMARGYDSCYETIFYGFAFAARYINIQIVKPYLFAAANKGGG